MKKQSRLKHSMWGGYWQLLTWEWSPEVKCRTAEVTCWRERHWNWGFASLTVAQSRL